jgi:hypothetical protein
MTWSAILMVVTVPCSADVEQAGVRIHVQVHSSEFEWEITNLSVSSIMAVEIPQHRGYNFLAPEGWETQQSSESVMARTTDRIRAIHPGQQKMFSLRVGSGGAVLGNVRMRVHFDNGESAVLPGVWGAVPEPRWTILLIPLVLTGICAIHVALAGRRDRRLAIGAG